jgi:hypothetical protein
MSQARSTHTAKSPGFGSKTPQRSPEFPGPVTSIHKVEADGVRVFYRAVRSILRRGPLRYSNLAHPVTDILPHPFGPPLLRRPTGGADGCLGRVFWSSFSERF